MTKASLLMDSHGAKKGPAIPCAESVEEAQSQPLPLFNPFLPSLVPDSNYPRKSLICDEISLQAFVLHFSCKI
jgi:hypothetical protein